MAKDENQIILSDGTRITIPAWASESTLAAMVMMTQRSNVLTRSMMKGIEKDKLADEATLEALKELVEGVRTNTESVEQEAKSKSSMLLKSAENIKETATFFGDSEKPLSSLVKAAEKLVNKLDGPEGSGGFAKLAKSFPKLGNFMKGTAGSIVGVATDVIFALAGWNAAKFEQFAEVQKKMIDSGAIMYQSADMFDKLYKQSFKAGITYNAFSDAVANFGGTMTAIGGDVSQGSVTFLKMFKSLSQSADILGDLGMLNKEMMETYANYIETQRLTGALDRKLAGQGDSMELSFTKLVVESTAMASLTALNRSDALQRQMAALSDPFLAAGAQTLRDQGLDKTAEVAEALMTQLSLFSDVGPGAGLMSELSESFNRNLNEFSNNIGNFQVETGMTQESRSAFDTAMPGFLGRINDMVQNGEMTSETAKNFMLQEFAKMDMERLATAGVEGGSPLKLIQELQASGILIKKNFGEWMKLDLDQIKAIVQETKEKLGESGKTTVAMNDMAKMFLTAQEAITLPMNKFGEALETVTNFLEGKTTSANETVNPIIEYFMGGDTIKVEEKALGGTAQANQPYIVGERGPELFVPNQTGTIIPNNATLAPQNIETLKNHLTSLEKQLIMLNSEDGKLAHKKQLRLELEIEHLNKAIKLSKIKIKAEEDKRGIAVGQNRFADTGQ